MNFPPHQQLSAVAAIPQIWTALGRGGGGFANPPLGQTKTTEKFGGLAKQGAAAISIYGIYGSGEHAEKRKSAPGRDAQEEEGLKRTYTGEITKLHKRTTTLGIWVPAHMFIAAHKVAAAAGNAKRRVVATSA